MIDGYDLADENWPLKKPFIISRWRRDKAETLLLELRHGDAIGRGEAVPNLRYDETLHSARKQIEAVMPLLQDGLDRAGLQQAMAAGSARNAVDSALWDLEAGLSARNVGDLTGVGWPEGLPTVQTISILPPDEMGREARALADFPTIKVKLSADQVVERVRAVRANAPDSAIIVDANESWSAGHVTENVAALADLGVAMVEQPLPAGEDDALADMSLSLPIYADESCHTRADLPRLQGKYQGINIKLDKTGGLTEALALCDAGKQAGFEVMVGCMLGTSLGIAPALFVAGQARFVDVDAPALLAKDRKRGLRISNGSVSALDPRLWGGVQPSPE